MPSAALAAYSMTLTGRPEDDATQDIASVRLEGVLSRGWNSRMGRRGRGLYA